MTTLSRNEIFRKIIEFSKGVPFRIKPADKDEREGSNTSYFVHYPSTRDTIRIRDDMNSDLIKRKIESKLFWEQPTECEVCFEDIGKYPYSCGECCKQICEKCFDTLMINALKSNMIVLCPYCRNILVEELGFKNKEISSPTLSLS